MKSLYIFDGTYFSSIYLAHSYHAYSLIGGFPHNKLALSSISL